MTGKDLNAVRDARRLRPADGRADRAAPVHGQRATRRSTRSPATEADPRLRSQQAPQHFAIVLDGEIELLGRRSTTPQIPQAASTRRERRADHRHGGRRARRKDLALVLQTGALPVNVRRARAHRRLGDARQGLARAGADRGARRAASLVALFLLVLYRFLGLVAVHRPRHLRRASCYAAILLFNVTLTLPGFAGLILTIGVAADANVVVFERIKEEARAGKSVRAAIAAGYAKGFHTIVDANVVTAITALVLFAVATAAVKGFALMLLIGTAISLITAVAATRAMLGLLAGFRWFENPQLHGRARAAARALAADRLHAPALRSGSRSPGVDPRRQRRLARRRAGLNLGIDFKGGTQITFQTHGADASSARSRASTAATAGARDAVVQGRGTADGSGELQEFQIRPKSLDRAASRTSSDDGPRRSNVRRDAARASKNVSASFGRQIAHRRDPRDHRLAAPDRRSTSRSASSWKFAVPVIVALLHDIVITVGVYSLTGREVTIATVAAVLTVLGYSIYDTIIIFDRIRENVPLMRRASFATIANVSLWETIRRSLATTFITLLPIGALFIFGGATLKDFAFALLIGVTSGAYSSIFVAAPLLHDLEGARARVRAAQGERHAGGRRPATACSPRSGMAAADGAGARDAGRRDRGGGHGRRRGGVGAGRGATSARSGGARGRQGASRPRRRSPCSPATRRALLVDDPALARRGDAIRVSEGSKRRVQELVDELGLVTREEWDELELRVAQLEHRLRLLEPPHDEQPPAA